MMKNKFHRPRYHFLPPANWINDPNGLIHWKGQYHLFYQHNPHGAFHANIHWGHAASPDLVHWQNLPIALTPEPGSPDQDGCWSGCIVDNHGVPTLFYTGIPPQTQNMATSDDDLFTWKKYPGNPVLPAPPPGLAIVGGSRPEWRDPWVWQEDNGWYMLVGSGIQGVGGAALLYQSRDLVHWEYLHPILTGNEIDLGEVWECPSLIPLDGKHILLVSPTPESAHTYWVLGGYTHNKLHPEMQGKTDHGKYFYAALPLRDESGRWLLWGWIKEGRSVNDQMAAGWSGVMSLPRLLSLGADGSLHMAPAPELTQLRQQHTHQMEITIAPGASHLLPGCSGACLEIIAEFEPSEAENFGLLVCASPDRSEYTRIGYDRASRSLFIDRSHSSLDGNVDHDLDRAPLPAEELKLHIFIDASVIEVFAAGHICLTSRVYPDRPDSLEIDLFAHGGYAKLKSLDVWTLKVD